MEEKPEKRGIDWSSLWRTEDWWSCWIGWLIILLAIAGIAPHLPKIGKWVSLAEIFPKGGVTVGHIVVLFIFTCVLTLIGAAFQKKENLSSYIPGFLVIFLLSLLANIVAHQKTIKYWGIPYVIWALIFGLVISNIFRAPKWLMSAVMTEFFIKIGLVCMGATILFSVVIKAGALGMGQALLVVGVVWFFAYWLGRKFGMSERFAGVMATGVSICGVSASIAAGGALKGDPKEVAYMIAWIMVCAAILIIVMPPLALWMGLPTNMAGAWIGGVIDNTGAVVAAGEVIKGKAAVQSAALVKMAQNVLIGFAAFLMALWATFRLDRAPGAERPSFMEVWYRFPKFIVGFVVASLIMTFLVEPSMGGEATKAIKKIAKGYRSWFFTYCFVCIGLETRFMDLVKVGGGRPAAAYWIAQFMNMIWTLIIVWILWSGTFFTPPILPD